MFQFVITIDFDSLPHRENRSLLSRNLGDSYIPQFSQKLINTPGRLYGQPHIRPSGLDKTVESRRIQGGRKSKVSGYRYDAQGPSNSPALPLLRAYKSNLAKSTRLGLFYWSSRETICVDTKLDQQKTQNCGLVQVNSPLRRHQHLPDRALHLSWSDPLFPLVYHNTQPSLVHQAPCTLQFPGP